MSARIAPLLLLLGFAFGSVPFAHADESSLPPISYRRLTWADYPINDTAPGMSAQTRTFLGYSLQAKVSRTGSNYTARADTLSFSGGMDRATSWRRSTVPNTATQLLQHEQGHLIINEIKRRQLQQVSKSKLPVGTGATARAAYTDLQARLRDWYQAHLRDLTQTQNRYDSETAHGTRAPEQRTWSARLEEALDELSAQS